jgi:hypothetical protein
MPAEANTFDSEEGILMKTLIGAAFACLLSGLTSRAQEPIVLPKTATPSIAIVRKVDRQKNEVTFAVMSISLQPAKGEADKKQPPKPPTVRRELQEFTTGLEGFEFMTVAGKEVSAKAGWERLKAGAIVIVSSDPRGVDPAFRAVLAPNAMMIVPIGWKEAQAEPKDKQR